MNKTKIPWVMGNDGSPGYTWNPVTGCSPISEGCQNCYAAAMAKRFHRPWGKPEYDWKKIEEPMKLKKPSRIFVCSTADLFHHDVLADWLVAVLDTVRECHWHTFIFLTKRPDRMKFVFKLRYERTGNIPFPNLWLGVTAENRARANERIPILLSIPAAVHFVSVEPMLGPVNLRPFIAGGLKWVIAGPENGPKKRPCDPMWIRSLQDQCADAGIPFFDKREDFGCKEFPI